MGFAAEFDASAVDDASGVGNWNAAVEEGVGVVVGAGVELGGASLDSSLVGSGNGSSVVVACAEEVGGGVIIEATVEVGEPPRLVGIGNGSPVVVADWAPELVVGVLDGRGVVELGDVVLEFVNEVGSGNVSLDVNEARDTVDVVVSGVIDVMVGKLEEESESDCDGGLGLGLWL